jgi:hypothetical protein
VSQQLRGDPEQMLEFSHFLNAWCVETRDQLGSVHARLGSMASGDWDDENYRRFVEEFEALAAQVMSNLAALDEGLVPELRRLAHRYQELRDGGA